MPQVQQEKKKDKCKKKSTWEVDQFYYHSSGKARFHLQKCGRCSCLLLEFCLDPFLCTTYLTLKHLQTHTFTFSIRGSLSPKLNKSRQRAQVFIFLATK